MDGYALELRSTSKKKKKKYIGNIPSRILGVQDI